MEVFAKRQTRHSILLLESERSLGVALQKSGRSREEYFLASKIMGGNLEPAKLRACVQETLDNLQTDYLDLMQV